MSLSRWTRVCGVLPAPSNANWTDADGMFVAKNLPPGSYQVIVQKENFSAPPALTVEVAQNRTSNANVQFGQPAAVQPIPLILVPPPGEACDVQPYSSTERLNLINCDVCGKPLTLVTFGSFNEPGWHRLWCANEDCTQFGIHNSRDLPEIDRVQS